MERARNPEASIGARERNSSGGFRELSWNKTVYRYGRFIPGFPTLPHAGEGFRLKHDCGARENALRNVQILRPKRYRRSGFDPQNINSF